MALFSNSELKSFADQAIGRSTDKNKKGYVVAVNDIIDEAIQKKIKTEVDAKLGNTEAMVNQTGNVLPNNGQGVSSPNTALQQGGNQNNVLSQLQAPQVNNATNTGATGNVPALPQLPSLPFSIEPDKFIPDLSSIPFSSFIKPIFDAALNAALSKLNVSSFTEQAQGSLGELSKKSQSNLQGVGNQAQGGSSSPTQQANDGLQNKINTIGVDLGKKSKAWSSQGSEAKNTMSMYFDMRELELTNYNVFVTSPNKKDYLLIKNAG